MTTEEIVLYYCNLLIIQYRGKPKATGMIQTLVTPVVMDQLPTQVMNAYALDSAIGVQLDVIGKYVGISRYGYTFTSAVTLNDIDYLTVIKLKIMQNSLGSSLADIQSLISIYFPGILRVFDYKNMHMDYFFDTTIGSSTLLEFFIKQRLLPKPMGVQMGVLIYAPIANKFFGFRTYQAPGYNISPFNTYSSYDTNSPWLNNSDVIYE